MPLPSDSAEPTWTPPSLVTERLVLRALTLADAPDVFRYASNPRAARYTLWEPHQSLDDSREFITGYATANYSQAVPDPLGITLAGDDRVVGTVGCFWAARQHHSMELGYALDEALWGRGIATEASRAVLDYVFANFEVERVQARCKQEHEASARVMKHLGMQREGTLRHSVFHQDHYWDIELYAVLKAEYLALRGGAVVT